MKILFIGPLPGPVTGQSLACKLFYDALAAEGHDVQLVNLSKDSLSSGVGSVRRIARIAKVILVVLSARKGCDLVYFNVSQSVAGNLKDLAMYLVLGRKLGLTFAHLHGGCGASELLSGAHPVLRWLNSLFLRRLAGVIVLGQRQVPIFQPLVEAERIHVVHNFAADEVFIGDDELKQKLAHDGPLRVLFLSNFLPGKGYQELVAAIGLLEPAVRSRLEFEFAGAFDSEEVRQAFMASIAGMEGVRYHGVATGVAKVGLLRGSHVFCLPTYYRFEGQPISILEGYAAGCAVLTTNHGGIYDVFTPGANGCSVEPRSPQSIAEALVALAQDRGLLARFAWRNVEDARAKFRPADHLAQLFQKLGLGARSEPQDGQRPDWPPSVGWRPRQEEVNK